VKCRAPSYLGGEAAEGFGGVKPLAKGLTEGGLGAPPWVALKMVNVPGSLHDPCVFHDLFSEVRASYLTLFSSTAISKPPLESES
jgi:hypothetical protein